MSRKLREWARRAERLQGKAEELVGGRLGNRSLRLPGILRRRRASAKRGLGKGWGVVMILVLAGGWGYCWRVAEKQGSTVGSCRCQAWA
ncbi:MAG: hypothetical protein DLM67_02125 [Candidatus Nephthysia bennettiae]|uniref:CsbD family protein n=1 Tax=Candidatus Nephthysia bennettiae TaxID=3127016 RepID=A0A934K171_9BACT|nr:hypothetical protein [Candidatus Dormibacteraeota bacterium]PZS00143.1 MAG: hypothetical protein DLM67_02125 [Candidatus Dormibacteraeota bacterium]